ncbi:hypothetical protein D3C75_1237710 [compost metagenome]
MQRLVQRQADNLAHPIIARLGQPQSLRRLAARAMDRRPAVHQGAVDVENSQGTHQAGTTSKAMVRRVSSPVNGTVPCHI